MSASGVFFLFLSIGLYFPDLDLLALPFLHHRSIITHSLLLPFIVEKVISRYFHGKFPVNFGYLASGLYAGFGFHLIADILSPAVGFGAIWFPWPVKFNIGLFTYPWLIINGLYAFSKCYNELIAHKLLFLVFFAAAGLWYALVNEGAVTPFVLFGLFYSIVAFKKNFRLLSISKSNEDT